MHGMENTVNLFGRSGHMGFNGLMRGLVFVVPEMILL